MSWQFYYEEEIGGGALTLQSPLAIEAAGFSELSLETPLAVEAAGFLVLETPLAIEASGSLLLTSPLAVEAGGEPILALGDVFTIVQAVDAPFNDVFTVQQSAIVGQGLPPLDDVFLIAHAVPTLTDSFAIYKQVIQDRFLLPSGTPRASGKQSGADLPISIIEVDSTTQLVADQFQAEVLTSEFYKNRDKDDTSDILIGIEKSDGSPELVSVVQGGTIDEYELTAVPENIKGRARGRDAAAGAVDATFDITYVSAPDPLTLQQEQERRAELIAASQRLFPDIPIIDGVTFPLRLVGQWRASSIAADLAGRVGLTLSWEAPDYFMREDFQVSGSVAAAVQQLVAPFSYFEPSKIDVWVDGKTLIVRQRAGLSESPRAGSQGAGSLTTLGVADPCILSLTVRAHFLGHIRTVRLTGATGLRSLDPGSLDWSGVVIPQIERFVVDNRVNWVGSVDEKNIRNVDGALFSATTSIFGWPPGVTAPPAGSSQVTAGPVELSRSVTVNTWDGPIVEDLQGNLLSTPLQTSSDTVSKELIDNLMTLTRHVHVDFFYDSQRFLSGQVDLTEELINVGGVDRLRPTRMKIRTLRDTTRGKWEEVIDSFEADLSDEGGNTDTVPPAGSAPLIGSSVPAAIGKWILVDHATNVGGGSRPGGPGRAGGKNVDDQTPISFGILIDNEPVAKDVTIDNRNLLYDDLRRIADQARDASGAWEYEINMTAANMPWLKKGQMLLITGWKDEDDEDLELEEAMIFDIRTTFDQSSSQARTLTSIKALWWSKL